MKAKVSEFILTLGVYCIIFLIWNNWNLSTKEIAEMIFLGTWTGFFSALMMNPMKRLTKNIVRKLLT